MIIAIGVLSIHAIATSGRFAGAAPSPWVAYVLTSGGDGGSAFPISTGTNVAGNPISSPGHTLPQAIAITPDGATAYVTDHYEAEQAIRTLDNSTVSISAGIAPTGIAVTPNGATAWVVDSYNSELIPISTATNQGGTPIPVPGGPSQLAITPDGATAYVVSGRQVTHVSLTSGQAGTPVTVFPPADASAVGIVTTPNASTLYYASNTTATSGFVAATTPGTTPVVTKTIGPFGRLGGIAMSPDGQTLWVTEQGSNQLVPIDVATNTPGKPFGLNTIPNAVAITPDGDTAYVSTDRCWVLVIDLTTGKQLAQVNRPQGASGCTSGVAVTPDQAPTAAFSVTPGPAGAPTNFDGSASSSPYRTVATYRWMFGDGATATTTGPTTSHVYAAAGLYTATLTVTNTTGTSTTKVFTGQTMSRNGGPTATRSLAVPIVGSGQPPPTTGGTTPSGGTTPPGGTPPLGGSPGSPALTVSPGVGPTGQVVTVVGTNFPANTSVVVRWNPGVGSVQVDTGPLGEFTTQLEILPHDQVGNRAAVAVGFPTAIAPMLVEPSATEPGGSNVAIIYHN